MRRLCFSFACLATILLISALATAAEQTVKGKIKSVDTAKNSITLDDLELDVTRKTKITVDGKKAMLANVKSGQLADVRYDDELDAAISIATGKGVEMDDKPTESVAYKKTGCRVVWAIAENGDSTVKISRPLEDIEPAKEGMIRHDDGTFEFQHDLSTAESVEKATMSDTSKNVEFDDSFKALVLTPKTVKGYDEPVALIHHFRLSRLPITLEVDFNRMTKRDWTAFQVQIRRQDSNTEFAILNVRDSNELKSTVEVSSKWVKSRDKQGHPQLDELLKKRELDLEKPKEVRFKIPSIDRDQPYLVQISVLGEPASVQRLSIRGRLVFRMGIALAEKNGDILVEKIIPKGLGETIGIKAGDIYVSINGNKPKSMKEALDLIAKIQFGEASEIVVKRNGEMVKIGFTAE